ncbi:hypothetical protein C095_01480 [Fusobacterium necrophorum subsp. funduliforme B35]|uniref:Uncharacterized protein n=1 Tax=Fusobacterium necrophorum subsp. funduliforme B35 TaxID=1226633 RepID=A0A0B4EYN7_9FUSO|nr:hypothetical protein C095_01480 [Fusobacterium necrophorum subsp. funduliforme B35]
MILKTLEEIKKSKKQTKLLQDCIEMFYHLTSRQEFPQKNWIRL